MGEVDRNTPSPLSVRKSKEAKMANVQHQDVIQRRRDPEEKRSRLLKAAKELFVEQGFDKTTTKKIVERSGVSEGVLYHQFESKLGIFRELIRLFAEDAVAEFTPDDNTELTPEQIIRNLISFIARDGDMFALIDNSAALLRENGIPGVSDLIIPEIERGIRANVTDDTILPTDPAVMAEFQYAIVETTYRGWLKSKTEAKKEAFIQEGVRSMNTLLFSLT